MTILESLLSRAVIKRRGESSHAAFYAFIPEISHVAFADGATEQTARFALSKQVAANLPRVLHAWGVLMPDLAESI